MDDQHREFLFSLDAHKTQHSGRTLFEHLKGVHDLLRDWDNEEVVCLAGLFHSIYGTNTFKHQSLQERERLTEMIGEHAELLVHLFLYRRPSAVQEHRQRGDPHAIAWRSRRPICSSRAARRRRCGSCRDESSATARRRRWAEWCDADARRDHGGVGRTVCL